MGWDLRAALLTPVCAVSIRNIHVFYPGIFKCISPHYAYLFFKHNRGAGWEMLSGAPFAPLS